MIGGLTALRGAVQRAGCSLREYSNSNSDRDGESASLEASMAAGQKAASKLLGALTSCKRISAATAA